MKRKALFLLAASIVMLAVPTKAWADGMNEALEVTSVKTLPYPLATDPIPASAMEYDSVAKCFVVRDTIMKSTSRWRSSVVQTVETRAAVAYTEDGVQYGYYGNQLSSKNMDEMRALLDPWNEHFKNLDIEGILTPASNGDETWYMQIVGVDNEELDDLDGEMRIYNDIGSTYNYKTIAIDGTALRGNTHIHRIVFEDCASSSGNANTDPKMVIHDGAFQNCTNLQELYMYYKVTKGSNHEEPLEPTDVYIGKNVFDGCHENFRIVVDPLVYMMFLADPNWGPYADKIVASETMPETIEEDGVLYGYYGYQLSSSRIDKMAEYLEPWVAEFRNIDIEKILTPAKNGSETWYMHIAGVNNDELDDLGGEMRIYNDIGTSYNYKTIAIDSTALRGNEHIKKVVFEDCASASENANTSLSMVIHNGAFKDCKYLTEFNMYYLTTDGSNRHEMLYPWDIYIGKNVFDGCHENFRIVVAPQLYNYFLIDENWSQYADKIVASDYMPTTYSAITHEGVTYDYAAKSFNTLPTSELTRLQSSWWNAAIIGAEIAITVATWGLASGATASAKASAQATAQATLDNAFKTATTGLTAAEKSLSQAIKDGVTGLALREIKRAHYYALVRSDLMAGEFVRPIVATRLYYMIAAGVSAATPSGVNGLGYVANTIGQKARREPTWLLEGQWLLTENKHTIYHMYVKDVENRETITLYNDIGSAYNYKTVAIGETAFHGKTNLKTIKFQDLSADAAEMYASMTVLIPDKAFKGCTNLETLDLIMRSTDTNPDRDVALGPENFIVCGDDLFEGCDMSKLKIRIGREKYEEFAENTVWGKYKDNFEVVDIEETVDFATHGAKYSYSFENNSRKKETYLSSHNIEHVHIIGQDTESLSTHGEVCLFNDAGAYNNYKLDFVKKKAFYGSEELKGISMFDLKGAAGLGDAYTDLELVLQDEAFANCSNLEYINMLYFRTDGKNSVEPMAPYRVMLGKDVFKDSPKLKIKMVTTAVDEFKADTAWAKYEDRFLPSFIMTEDPALKEALEACGMKYYSPIWNETFDIYDVMQVTDPTVLNGKFQGKAFAEFRDFKAFEHINLTAVPEAMFMNCTKLQSIELPSTLQGIYAQAFKNCAVLDDVVIPAGVFFISTEAFIGCSQLKSLTFLSANPPMLGNDVFSGLPKDYVFYVPEAAVETYKQEWTQHADHIQSVSSKPSGIFEVTLTEPGTLAEKLGLTIEGTDPLTISGNYGKYDSLKIVGPINGTDVGVIRFLGGRDVNNCEVVYAGSLKYLDLYDAHIKAGGADYNQDGSNDYITEDNSIDTYMFWELDKLETLILPKSATKIKDNAFYDCNVLSRLVIGDNVQSIGEEVTHDSPQLRELIMLGDQVAATDADAWAEDTHIPMLYTTNATRAHLSGSYVYYTRIDSISSAFENDAVIHALAEKRIYTTDDLGKLKSFENVIAGNINIERFRELIFATEVEELGDNSLSGCSALKEVMLPYGVKSISAGAFRGCSSLTALYVGCEEAPTLAADALEDLPEDFVIYVKNGEEDKYRQAWPQYADHIQGFRQLRDEIKVVTVTEAGTLGEALGFTVDMDSPSNVGRISGDLINLTALKVIGPINGKDIAVLRMLGGREEEDGDEVALARMSYLDLYEATICTDPDNICFNRDGNNDYVEADNVVPEHMFWQLDKLQTVILPKDAVKIDDNAFYDNLGIETIVVGDATTEIGNDAFGKCKNLKNIVFLCNEKPELNGDAFTDPVSDQPYQVEKMYIPASLYQNYTADEEYTTHTKEFCTKYDEDALFRAYGSHAVMNNDQLPSVTDIDGWFIHHNSMKDLSSLGKSGVDTLKASTLAPLSELQKITLPATLTSVEDGVFAANTKLQWADFSQCIAEGVLTESNIGNLGINEHALIYAPESFTATGFTNVVYGSEGSLKCDYLTISDEADYAVPREFKASAISYDRQFEQGKTSILCLPFDMEVPVGAIAYKLTSSTNEAIMVSPIIGAMKANTPYVIQTDENMSLSTQKETVVPVAPARMPEVAADHYKMIGTLATISAEKVNSQHMYLLGDDDIWYRESGQALLPYRVYLQSTLGGTLPSVQMYENIDESMQIVDGDYTKYEVAKIKGVRELTYTRTLNNTWNALYVPFQVELTEDFLANYDVAYINDVRSYDNDDNGEIDGWEVEIIKIKNRGKKLNANYPYVIRPKNEEAVSLNITQRFATLYSTAPEYQNEVTCSSAFKQYAVKGVYAKTVSAELDGGNYVYAINKNGEWQKMGLETSLVPFRLYLTMANRDGSPIVSTEFAAQSIRMRLVGEENEEGTTVIYDLEVTEEQTDNRIYDLQGRRVLDPQKGNLYIINGKKVVF